MCLLPNRFQSGYSPPLYLLRPQAREQRYLQVKPSLRATGVDPLPVLDVLLLKRFQPMLMMSFADVPPIGLEELLRHAILKRYQPHQAAVTVSRHPTLALLQQFNAPEYFLSFSPKALINAEKNGLLKPVIYGKAFNSHHFKVLYYFYYFLSSGFVLSRKPEWLQKHPVTIHQGDAEGVQIFLQKSDLKPVGLFAFRHYGGKSLLWKDIKQVNGHPVIELDAFSHASHAVNNSERSDPSLQIINPELRTIGVHNDLILSWRGRIGNFSPFPLMNYIKETLPSVTAGYRGPIAEKVSPETVSLRLNAVRNPEATFLRYLPTGTR